MTEDRQYDSQGRVAVHLASTSISAPPGVDTLLSLLLLNRGTEADFFKLSVEGVAAGWVTLPSPVVRIRPQEQRDVSLVVRPPDADHVRVGRYPLTVRVASHSEAGDVVEVEGMLIVSAVPAQGRVGLLLASTSFSVVPGGRTTIPVVLLNQGVADDSFRMMVDGIPQDWVSDAATLTLVPAGQQKEVPLTLRPPVSAQTRAGRHRFRIRVVSKAHAAEGVEADCVLAVGTYTELVAVLQPLQVEARQPARVLVENQGNHQAAFRLTWKSLNDELAFEPGPSQSLRVAAGQTGVAEFWPVPRHRPLFGGGMTHPFTVSVQAPDAKAQSLSGEVSSRALLPTWLLAALVIVALVLTGVSIFALARGELPGMGPLEPVSPQTTPAGEGPLPTVESPTGLQPEASLEQPTAGPAEVLPCSPVALGLVLVPRLARGGARTE